MPRICAPISKQLSRSVSSSVAAAARSAGHQNAGAVLLPQYAELLGRSEHGDSSRSITTTHRPAPQPSIANRKLRLMQTFHSFAASPSPSHGASLDATVLPSWDALYARPSEATSAPIVPILPDNYGARSPAVRDAPTANPEITIVAVDPDRVAASSPFVEVTGLDGVDLKFAQQREPVKVVEDEGPSGGMLRDIWKGMVEDVLGKNHKSFA